MKFLPIIFFTAAVLSAAARQALGYGSDPVADCTAAQAGVLIERLQGLLTGAGAQADARAAVWAAFARQDPMLLATLPEEIRGAYAPLLTGETQARLHDLVKAADKLSAYIKCIEERKTGNDEFLSAERQTRAILEASPLPEVQYFMEHFIPAFELTLDELGTIEE